MVEEDKGGEMGASPQAGQPALVGYADGAASVSTKGFDQAQLLAERDEADRRAGAAERRLADLQDERQKRIDWLRRAKREAGYSDNASFDEVWAAALPALLEKRNPPQPPPFDGMAVMDHGMRTSPRYAAKEIRGRGLFGLIHNLERLQDWLDAYVAHAFASADTHAKRGDEGDTSAPSPMGSAVPPSAGDATPSPRRQPNV